MTLSVHAIMPFGKHKGLSVKNLILQEPEYACWLREDAKKADPRKHTFDIEANDMIDIAISRSRILTKKYRQWNLSATKAAVPTTATEAAVKTGAEDPFKAAAERMKRALEDQEMLRLEREAAELEEMVALAVVARQTRLTKAYSADWGAW